MYRKRSRNVAAPLAVTSSVEQVIGQKTITIHGREYLRDVTAGAFNTTASVYASVSSLFQSTGTLINPTDSSLFAWLTQVSSKFEEYKFNGLQFVYEPQCASSTTGSVGMYFDPDPTNTPPQTWATLTNTGANVHGAPWVKHVLPIPRMYYADRKQYYVKDQFVDGQGTTVVGSSTTQQYFDPLEYFIGSIGSASVGVTLLSVPAIASGVPGAVYQVLGKIYLDYSITFKKSTLDTSPRTAYLGNMVVNQGTPTVADVPYNAVVVGRQVSPFWANNSGAGCYLKLVTALGVAASQAIFGTQSFAEAVTATAAPTNAVQVYGDQYFQFGPNIAGTAAILSKSGVIALQTVDLMYVVALDVVTTAANCYWHFENFDNQKSTLSAFQQMFSIPASASTGAVFVGMVHIQQGERCSLVMTQLTGQMTVAGSHITLSPMTWGINF